MVGGKGVYIWFPTETSFGNISCWDGILPKRSNNGWDHLMHAIELGNEVEGYSKNKQKGILS